MSVRVMARVWAHSQQKGGELLIMLALADFANDEGECWPHIGTLAAKARLTERQVKKLLPRLEQAGELRLARSNGGKNRPHHYFVTVAENGEQNSVKKIHRKRNGEQNSVNSVTSNGELEFTRIEPSRTVIEREGSQSLPHSKKEKRVRPAVPLEQFEFTETLRAWCVKNHFSEGTAEAELPKFVDWHLANGKRPKDNEAAFRNWLRRDKDFQSSNGNGANGHARSPAQVKDLGNGMIEVDGRQMDHATYERRFANGAAK